jgi:cytochrome P450
MSSTITPIADDIPAHVPSKLVRIFDFYNDPKIVEDPFEVLSNLQDGPRIFWNAAKTRHETGSWVLTRAADIREVLSKPNLFSSNDLARFFSLVGEDWQLIPVELDPPIHTVFRKLMNPWLSVSEVDRLSPFIRDKARTLVTSISQQRHCNFTSSFAEPFPVEIFVDFMGLPKSDVPIFLGWVQILVRSADPVIREDMARSLIGYMANLIQERKAEPRDDLISRATKSRIDDRLLTDSEVLRICCLLFLGGMDTVTSVLGFQFKCLATNIELQERLRRDPSKIGAAVEELLRAFSPVVGRRCATEDTEIAGVQIRAGDWVTLPHGAGSRDPSEFSSSTEIDIDRSAPRHLAFGFGPHFCMGMQLARRELTVAVEEWLRQIPVFSLANEEPITHRGGGVLQVADLELRW